MDTASTLHRPPPVLSQAETAQLQAWGQTTANYPIGQTIISLFGQQAEQTPGQIAVVFAGRQLSYQQLNAKANQLAHYLIGQGVRSADLVAICAERSPDMLIGLLGILKAGGVYVPIDPNYPAQRIRHMLEDSAAPLLLTQTKLRARLAETRANIIDLDELDTHAQPTANPVQQSQANDLAYVIYTSGSTGQPKGVMVSHQAAAGHLQCMAQHYRITPNDKVLQFASFSFDTSIEQTFSTWLAGATLYVLADNRLAPKQLAHYLAAHQISVANLPPAYWHQLYATELADQQPWWQTLRLLILGGEALPLPLAQATVQRFPDLVCLNAYGPTEATITATAYPLPDIDTLQTLCSTPIGRPTPGRRIYILDEQQQPLPPGEPGELCIGGDALAQGYLNQPELTAEKFIQATLFGCQERLYRSGDLARWLPDGNLEFLRRIDQQIKLRGYRIELGEIETALAQHASVKQCLVVCTDDADSRHQRLLAYIVPHAGNTLTETEFSAELRDALGEQLPDYMLPAAFVVLAAFPLTINGKIDREALPVPAVRDGQPYVAPRHGIEQTLATIWAGVLGVEPIGRQDNFFALGGNSLLAAMISAHIRQRFAIDFSVDTLFQQPVLAQLAQHIAHSDHAKSAAAAFVAPAMPADKALPIALTELVFWFADQFYRKATHFINDGIAYHLRGPLDTAWLQQSVQHLAQQHSVLRTSYTWNLTVWLSEDWRKIRRVIQPADDYVAPFEQINLQHLPPTQREAAAREQMTNTLLQNLSIRKGPLWRCVVWQTGENEYWLLWVMHHIISDAWTFNELAQKISANYQRLRQGLPLQTEENTLDYEHYAVWQWDYFASKQAQAQQDYWCGVLRDLPPPLTIPGQKKRFALPFRPAAVNMHRIDLPNTFVDALKTFSRNNDITLFITLLAALKLVLSAYTRQHDIVVASTFANRSEMAFANALGAFINILPIRTNLQDCARGRDLLAQVKTSSAHAIAHQQTPSACIARWIKKADFRKTERALLQIFFNLVDASDNNLALGEEMQVAELPVSDMKSAKPAHIADNDLNITLEQNNQGISGILHYRETLFNPGLMAQFCANYQTVLQRLMDDPDAPIANLLKDLPIGGPAHN